MGLLKSNTPGRTYIFQCRLGRLWTLPWDGYRLIGTGYFAHYTADHIIVTIGTNPSVLRGSHYWTHLYWPGDSTRIHAIGEWEIELVEEVSRHFFSIFLSRHLLNNHLGNKLKKTGDAIRTVNRLLTTLAQICVHNHREHDNKSIDQLGPESRQANGNRCGFDGTDDKSTEECPQDGTGTAEDGCAAQEDGSQGVAGITIPQAGPESKPRKNWQPHRQKPRPRPTSMKAWMRVRPVLTPINSALLMLSPVK